MNFMNNSIFQRNKACEREEENPEEGGVLAVWGSPSSGKTVVSVKMAEHLAQKKRNVILILADMITPPLPYLCVPSLHVLSEERTSVHNRNVERRECIHISAL